ncbi:cysteine--tRNA ligase [Parvibaculum sp.]|jgi:cysteinyl-tRNA synthetase|uniref:cysteine--tRNA ligase n=1 Tax=Parvibaculum sp. TaxID=2024848 RepID=UPI000C69F8BE|nr:cysteine--tRNA ligase [Parvibaculum sp.]MAU60139.1 cysteine--tRNA ligase [Parvibaculum sp.]MBO6669558.1 cysteine--tRNA ligase [Parvibaculum sp.]MBO6691987.1 cysteine--tRNA ligase [Parvibaculum sp.]MBO6715944.1 cysteine--tRNA ligase [Parvibaculum sp.]|tara:strand:- start:568 stop:1974 length:1407 start_codon:yes stop_codon:yes gene_type:complete
MNFQPNRHKLTLHNNWTRKKEVFEPADPNRVTMYVCGPTVYNYAHIGNARPAVVFDVLARVLKRLYPHVVYARNITDIEDKIIAAAKEQGVEISAITEKYADIYRKDMGTLGVLAPDLEPKATETIPEMIAMMERLIEDGHAYAAEGHVLFDVQSYAEYGRLSGRDRDEMVAGARVEVAPYKKDPADFVLWKPSTPEQPGWDSPWGRGRPGWHIECSAMIEKHLGQTIDIHGGGIDLQFPHHENEVAQSTCAHHGAPLARFWLHNGFVNIESEKMSKSLGNVLLVHDLIDQAPGEAIRLALLNGHYRQPLDWTAEGLAQAKRMLDRLYGALRNLADVRAEATSDAVPDAFLKALLDDLNTPKALAELFAIAKRANTETDPGTKALLKAELIGAGRLIGILEMDPEAWFAGGGTASHIDGEEIERLIAARNAARKEKNFAEADRIRDELAAKGVQIEDGPQGTSWRVAS